MDCIKLKNIYPSANTEVLLVLSTLLDKENWTEENKIHFLAQCAHESAGFRCLRENLNYSAHTLLRVFPKYFTEISAEKYARKPNEIADIVYAHRIGNGNIESHDGSRFKGRGLIQITGRSNYTAFGYENDPEYLETPEGAVKSAIWFWNRNKLYEQHDIKVITKKVNGGYNGLEDRINCYNKIKNVLGII